MMKTTFFKQPVNYFVLFLFLMEAFSCQVLKAKKISFEGELYAKNLVTVHFNIPGDGINAEYLWYVASSADGEWEKLEGIHTKEIILLTSYVGKYLKCEVSYDIKDTEKRNVVSVVSSKPVEYKGNPNTDWFKDAGYGIMVHYLKEAIVPEGGSKEWNDAVNSFDVEKFARQAKKRRELVM